MNTIRDIELAGRRVLVRCDFNVPLDEEGKVADDFRIRKTLPTISYLLEQGAKVILSSHLGDPEGKAVEGLRLGGVRSLLEQYLGVRVSKTDTAVGPEVEKAAAELRPKEVLLLENLRFHPGEQENDPAFADALASLGDLYCNDAFSVCHRPHASVVGVPRLLPSAAGFLLEREVRMLGKLLNGPEHPVVALVGGTKVESKLPAIERILERADWVLVGHLIAKEAKEQNISFPHAEKIVAPVDGIPTDELGYDIGPKTRKLFSEKLRGAATVFWSGPLGRYEEEPYGEGSLQMANAIAESGAFAVLGGGNTVAFLGEYGIRDKFEHISTGGSAMLAFLAEQVLPGLQPLGYYGAD